MQVVDMILFFVIGLAIGSFLNVLIFRIDDLKSVIYTRSHCPSCKHVLAWYDLIPFLSFVLLRAKCRYCKTNISWQYPFVELGVGLLFLSLYLIFGLGFSLIFYLLIFSILTVIFVYDIRTQTVPEYFSWAALGLALLGGWYFGGYSLTSSLLGALIAGGFLGLLVLISREQWMGAGDIKIGITLGLLTGYPNALLGLFLAFIMGSVVGLLFILLTKKSLKSSLPFAPFLILSSMITLVFGRYIVDWYIATFFIF